MYVNNDENTEVVIERHICKCHKDAPCKKTAKCSCSTKYSLEKKLTKN